MTVRELVLETVREMPPEVSWDELFEELRLLADMRRSDGDIDAGNFVTHEEVEREIETS